VGDCLNEVPIPDRRITTGTHALASPAFKPLTEDTNDVRTIGLDDYGLGLIECTKQLQDGAQLHAIISCMADCSRSSPPIFRYPCPTTRPGIDETGTVCGRYDCHH
jgi:hypothetical protein